MAVTYEAIALTTLASTTSSVTFSSIPNTYTDLVLVCVAQDGTSGTAFSNVQFQLNNDTGANYSWTEMYAYSTTATGQRSSSTTGGWAGYMSSVSGTFSTHILNFLGYGNTTSYKPILSRAGLGAVNPNTTTAVQATASLWASTAAITTIKLNGAISFAAGSTFSLYGIKAA